MPFGREIGLRPVKSMLRMGCGVPSARIKPPLSDGSLMGEVARQPNFTASSQDILHSLPWLAGYLAI